jgi:hypothetical protein
LLPALLLLCVRLDRRLRVLTAALWFAMVVSFVGCVGLTYTRPTWAFYLLPTRAWELIAGCLLAVAATKPPTQAGEGWRSMPGLIGVSLLAVSFIFLHEGVGFPGYVAAVPVVGTMLCIGRRHATDTVVERCLAHPLLVVIGKASYSLYLWHWPVYCFVDYGLYDEPALMRTVIKVALTLLLSAVSYIVLEVPARKSLNNPANRRLAYWIFVAIVIGGVLAGLAVRREFFVNSDLKQVRTGGVSYPAAMRSPKIVLVGDSNGSMYGRTVRNLCAEQGWGLNVLSVAAGNPYADTSLHTDTIAVIREIKPDVVVVAGAWAGKLEEDAQVIDRFVDELLESTSGVVLLTQPPIPDVDVNRQAIRDGKCPPYHEDASRTEARRRANDHVRSLGKSNPRIALLDVESLFAIEPGIVRFTDDKGRQLWQDATHLSGAGADLVKNSLSDAIHGLLQDAPKND